MIHEYTTLPGHDPRKVRGADCIIASASEALDVRVLQVAEALQGGVNILCSWGLNATATDLGRHAETLRDIAAEIRDEATPSSPRTTRACREALTHAQTEADLARAWRDINPTVMTMTMLERLDLMQAFITRMCVVTQDDGR